MKHEDEGQLAAYALDALDLEERQPVADHLGDCAACRDILASYERVADGLLHAPPTQTPPRRVRSRLMKQIGKRSKGFRFRRRWQTAYITRFSFVLGLIILLAINIGVLAQNQQLVLQNRAVLSQQQAGQAAVAIASYPSSQVAVIEQDGVRGTFVYDPELPVGVVYLWGLEPPPNDQAYQAWLVDPEGQRLNGGLLTFSYDRGFGWLMIEAPSPLSEFSSLGITLEPVEGSVAPTGPRVVGTDL